MAVAIPIIIILIVAVATTLVLARTGRAVAPVRCRVRPGGATRRAAVEDLATVSTSTELETDRPRARRRDPGDATRACPPGGASDVTRWEPVDEEELGVNRRQFLNRGLGDARRLLARRLRRRVPRLPVADRLGRLRRQDRRRQDQRHRRLHRHEQCARSTCRRRARTSCSTRRRTCPRPRRSTARSRTPGWSRDTSRSTSGACTSGAACRGVRRRSGSSARATVRSTTGSARRRPAPRRVASTGSASTSSGGSLTINTGDIEIGPPIGTNTTGQQQEGPLCV